METENLFYLNNQRVKINFMGLEDDELNAARKYVEVTRHIQEIRRYYKIFLFNLDLLLSEYSLINDGKVKKDEEFVRSEEHFIAINALVYNVIGAGRTLSETIENFIKGNFTKDDEVRRKFLKFNSGIYDSSFAYRLLIRLRDYSQHGHLPVNIYGDWFGFDLHQILTKPHYNHNGLIKQQLEGAVQDVYEVYGDKPRLSLAMTLAEYTASLMVIYNQFWISVIESVVAVYKQFCEVVKMYPENICSLDKEGFELFIYDVEDESLQTALLNEDIPTILSEYNTEAEQSKNKYLAEWEALKESVLCIRVTDGKAIEMGPLMNGAI